MNVGDFLWIALQVLGCDQYRLYSPKDGPSHRHDDPRHMGGVLSCLHRPPAWLERSRLAVESNREKDMHCLTGKID